MAGRLEIPLDNFEAYAYSLIPGPTAIEDVAPLLASTGAQPVGLIQHLLLLGLVRLQEQQASAVEVCEREEVFGSKALAEKVESLLRSFEVATLYEILSVPPDSDVDQIKTAYYELARQYHPDRFQSDQYSAEFRAMIEKLFTHITGAYATLSDPAGRIAYDETRLKQESPVEAALQSQASPDAENEKMAETLFRVARGALAEGDYQKAAAQLSECVWLCPDCAKYHHLLGVAQSEIPRLRKEAESHLLMAIGSNDAATGSRIALGKLYMKVNLSRKAKAQFEEVLRWDSDNPEALKLLALTAK
jgi:curved DNA-binding protein CbpA